MNPVQMTQCPRKVLRGRKCARVLHETLLVPVRVYGSKIMIWKEKENPIVRGVQMDNLRDLLVIRRID